MDIMMNKLAPWQKTTLTIAIWIVIAILFSYAYTQSPLYEGNQNTKFLHGLAQAGVGNLQDDWLANTVDPLPVFSGLVSLTARINPNLFYLEYCIMFGIYVFSLWGILTHVFRAEQNLIKKSLFLGLIFLYHARYILIGVNRRLGLDLSYLHNGVAQQYLLGLEFQTNVFGVLLLLSIYLFRRRRYMLAMVLVGLAAIVHPAYLFSSALLTIAYCSILLWENLRASVEDNQLSPKAIWVSARQPVLMGIIGLVLVLPVIIYNQTALAATSPETYKQAMHLLVFERIPHHSLPQVWLGASAYLQIGLILGGIFLARKSRLGAVMLVMFSGATVFTIIQMITGSLLLAAIAPWRVSVLLVPLGTAIILTAAVSLVVDLLHLDQGWYQPVMIGGVLLLIAFLAYKGYMQQQFYGTSLNRREIVAMMDYVRDTKQPRDLYMIPPKEAELNDFRLYIEAPTFINWKSHPYKDTDLLEWHRRVETASAFYDAAESDQEIACQLLEEIESEYGVTHVVVKGKDAVLDCPFVTAKYAEPKYSVFARVRP
jgi:hypothetical protein